MGVIFGPDAFTVSVDTNIDAYPSGSPNYAYNRGSGSNITVKDATDRTECIVNADTVARCINANVSPTLAQQEARADLREEGASPTGSTPGLVVRYDTSTRGYVGRMYHSDVNEVQILEDEGGLTTLASADRGLVTDTTYAASLRITGYDNGALVTLIIGGTVALTQTETGSVNGGAPGIYGNAGSGPQPSVVDNFLVDDLSGFPLVAGVVATNGTTATTSAVVSLPGAIRAGETLIILIRCTEGGTITFPSEGTAWIQLFENSADASNDTTAAAWRKADGTEGATITVTLGTSGKFAAIVYRIINAIDPTIQAPEFATIVTGTSTTPDPGTVTPTGGSKKYLFIWAGGWEGEQTSPPASFPTNYNSPVGADSGTAGAVATNCRVATAYRENEASSENPGSWTISSSDDWTATVIAVHPVGTVQFMAGIRELPSTGGWIGGGDI